MSFSNKIVVYTCAINAHPVCVVLYIGPYGVPAFKEDYYILQNQRYHSIDFFFSCRENEIGYDFFIIYESYLGVLWG